MRRAWPWLILVVVLAGAGGAVWWNARAAPSMERKSITSGGERREFAWFTPESVADDVGRHPVVIALHSLGMEGEGMAYVGAWGEPAQAGEFLVAFPDGLDDSWNAGTCCGDSMRNGVDDIGFINDLIAWVRTQPNVDPDRISLAGFSNGGMLALAIACNPPEGVNAVVTTGALPTAGCTPEVPPDVLLLTSSSDPVVPPRGGTGALPSQDVSGAFPSLEDSVRSMSEAHGCDGPTPTKAPFPGVLTSRTCAGSARLDTAFWPELGHGYDGSVTDLMVWWLGLTG